MAIGLGYILLNRGAHFRIRIVQKASTIMIINESTILLLERHRDET
ncbi:Uncharacterised protein [Klebsiella pneumoniae]|nr:Uncharacterised protein [Klebsiella pneumoniae]